VDAALRSPRERLGQGVAFELVGIVLFAPLGAACTATSLGTAASTLASLSLLAMAGSAAFNVLFDRVERRWTGRVASDRPHALRLVHALLHEICAIGLTWPWLAATTDLAWGDALCVDLALSAVYAGYGYVFHLLYDRMRPVAGRPSGAPPRARAATLGADRRCPA